MTTTPFIGTPFIGSEALADGQLRRHHLRSRFRAVFPDVYLVRGVDPTLGQCAKAAWLWSHRRGVLAGVTASAWHGASWVDEHLPIELVWSNARPPRGIHTYDMRLPADEITLLADVPVTTPQRSAFDIGRHGSVGAAVARIDALMQATDLTADDVADVADRHHGARGLRQLETVLALSDPGAQSPKETWLRLLLVRAGLPRPTTQFPVVGPDSGKTYYLDHAWETSMVAAEYDGEHHRLERGQYRSDIRRREELDRLGWIVIRVVAGDRPADIVRRVRDALEFRQTILR